MSRKSRRIYRLFHEKKASGFQEALFIPGGVAFRNPDLRPCPCGEMPVIQQSVYTEQTCWVIRCPKCELRAASAGSYDLVRLNWNTGRFSPDSLLVAAPIRRVDTEGLIALIKAMRKQKIREKERIRKARRELYERNKCREGRRKPSEKKALPEIRLQEAG